MIALATAFVVSALLALGLVRLFAGTTLHDRALAVISTVMKATLVCAALAVAMGQTAWIDVAFALVLGCLVLAAAALKFFRTRTFQPPLGRGVRG